MSKLAIKTLTGTGSFVVPNGVTAVKITGQVNATQNYFNNAILTVPGASISPTIRSDGSVWNWGLGTSGQLGDGTVTSKSSPISILGFISFSRISGGNAFVTGIRGSDGSAWAWGSNTNGSIGDNTLTNRSSPVSVVGSISFTDISSTVFVGSSTLAIRGSDGSAWAWGIGTSGELGDNTVTSKSSPVSVLGANSYTRISAGNGRGAAIRGSDGSAWCWGTGGSGPNGDNTTNNRSSPVSVVGNISFTRISRGGGSTLAIRGSDGSAWAWGLGTSGELGDNTVTSKSSPVSVLGNNSYTKISSSNAFSAGIRGSDGSAWCWGNNPNGQLGNNTTTGRSSPVSVVGNHSFIDIVAGSFHVLAVKADGSLWAWGDGSSGTLGNNSVTSSSSPIVANYTIDNFAQPKYGNKIIDRIISVTPGATITISSINGVTTGNPSQGIFYFFNNTFIGAADSISIEWIE